MAFCSVAPSSDMSPCPQHRGSTSDHATHHLVADWRTVYIHHALGGRAACPPSCAPPVLPRRPARPSEAARIHLGWHQRSRKSASRPIKRLRFARGVRCWLIAMRQARFGERAVRALGKHIATTCHPRGSCSSGDLAPVSMLPHARWCYPKRVRMLWMPPFCWALGAELGKHFVYIFLVRPRGRKR